MFHLASVAAGAVVPEQLSAYVEAVSGSRCVMCGDFAACVRGASLVLIAYPTAGEPAYEALLHAFAAYGSVREGPEAGGLAASVVPDFARRVDAAAAEAAARPGIERITVLAPLRPPSAPLGAVAAADTWWSLGLPFRDAQGRAPGTKLRNMLRRAERDLDIVREIWSPEHAALTGTYLRSRMLAPGTRTLFNALERYAVLPGTVLYAARSRADGALQAFVLGDLSAFSVAFYMFAFRAPCCPPGGSDLLLARLADAAVEAGHTSLNLGLGINNGITFFKRKWNACALLPHVETTWNPARATPARKGGLLRRLFGPKTAENGGNGRPDALSANPAFREPGVLDMLKEAFLGVPRPLDCVQIEVSTRCAGRCTYCPHTTAGRAQPTADMDDAVFAALWPLLRRSGRAHLQGWGEPLLHPRFFEFTALARRAGCRVSTTTCGLGMTEALAENLVKSGIDVIGFSLTGTEAAANACRQGVDFERTLEAIRTLQAVRRRRMGVHLEVHIAYLLTASRLESLRGLPDLLEAVGAHAAVISTLDYVPDPQWRDEAFAPHETDKIAAARAVLEDVAARAARNGRDVFYALPGPEPCSGCRERTDSTLFVNVDGDISPCVYLNPPAAGPDPHRLVFGNVLRDDPTAVWELPAYAAFRAELLRGRAHGRCEHCAKRFEQGRT